MIVFILFCFCVVVQGAYWTTLAIGFRKHRPPTPHAGEPTVRPISVVVAARDEEAHLPALLDALAAQRYPRFEVVVVNDGSKDSTAEIVASRARRDDRFRLVTVAPVEPRKKNALSRGIREARFERLAFTDADCRPGPGWLASVAAHTVGDGDSVVVGYSPFDSAAGLVNRVSRYETFVTGFLTAAAIGLGTPYMAVGRNLSYTRRLFDHIGGFGHSLHSLSGDDDLLVQWAARRGARIVQMFGAQSYVTTSPPQSWTEWIRQKRRHTSAGRYYRPSVKAHLALFHVTGHGLWLAPLFAGLPGLGLLAVRLVVQRVVLGRPAAQLGEKDLLPLMPVWELAYALYNVVVAPLGLLFPPRSWGKELSS